MNPRSRGADAILRLVVCAAAALLTATSALAQGRVAGTVKDHQGHGIKGATITAHNPDAAPSSLTTATDAKGHFVLIALRGGQWRLTVGAPGFEPIQTVLTVRMLGGNPLLDLRLESAPELTGQGPMSGVDVADLQQRLDAAAAIAVSDRSDEAIAAYRDILARVPALTSLHLQLGLLYERRHEPRSAAAEYQALLEADPGNSKARAALDRLGR